MNVKKSLLIGLASLLLGTTGVLSAPSNVSAHTWCDGTPSAVRGTWHTKNVYSNSLGISAHAFFKAKAHSVICGYTQSAPSRLENTYWRKVGKHAYSIHGAYPGNYGFGRITIKKIENGLIRIYINGSSSTESTPFLNLYHKAY